MTARNLLWFGHWLMCGHQQQIRRAPRGWFGFRLALGLCIGGLALLRAGDWPGYRGPRGDGSSSEILVPDWSAHPPRRVWRRTIDPALSSLSVVGGRVFTQVRRARNGQDEEWCVALDADTGAELWATPLGKADYPNGGVGDDDGPRSTPAVRNGRVFVLTSYLRLVCLAAESGAMLWDLDFVEEYGSRVINWQNAASPLLVGDWVLVNGNASGARLAAVRQADGEVVWRRHDDKMTQSTPVAAAWGGVPQVVFFTQSGLVSVAPADGRLLWRYAFPYSVSTAASPVVADDLVYCSAAYGKGAGAARIGRAGATWSATQVWRTPGANMNHWATPIHHEGFLYGIYGQSSVKLQCLDAATGRRQWSHGGEGRGGLLKVGGHLLLLAEGGDVVLIEPDPARYRELGRFAAVSGKCWNVPALSHGRLYVRSTRQVAAYDLASVEPPALALAPARLPDGAGVRVELRAVDGSALDAARAGQVELLSTTNLPTAAAEWTAWPAAGSLQDGALRWDDTEAADTPRRFFKVRENR